ncbi:MAG: serine hydrolase domain-containing protein [Chitinophagales bacterium]
MVNIAKFLRYTQFCFQALLFSLWLLLPSLSCNESSARHESHKYAWEHPEPLNKADVLLAFRIDTFFQHKVKLAGMNGTVLVAHNGKVIYQNCFGFADYHQKTDLTDSATFQLASVSKPITATAVLLLHERNQLNIDDLVSKYIKGFPYEHITIRQLLNHRSGLANYIYLFDTMKLAKDNFITNHDVVDYFVTHKPALQATPGHKFQYSNTNYALLAYIVEQVSGKLYPVFLEENIFTPSHMYHTYVRDVTDSTRHNNQTVGYIGTKWTRVGDVPYDGVTGDKGVYTTAWDLYLFDQALNNGLLLKKELLDEAYKGYSYEKPGQKNYGLGWRLKEFEDSSRIIYHNGWWRGYNTLFVRKPEEGTCIIVLANKYNRNVYNVAPLYEMLGLKAGEKEGEE